MKEQIAYELIFRDGTRKPYRLTSAQGTHIKLFLKDNKESFLELPDGEIIQKYEIKSVKPVKRANGHALAGRTTTCEYGKKHPIEEDCFCRKEEWNGVIWIKVWDYFKELKPDLVYNSQITEEMREYAKKKCYN